MFASSFRRFGAGLALSAVAVLAGCSQPEPLASTNGSISDLVTNVAVRGGTVPGVLQQGAAPTGTTGPTATVAGISAAVNGGSAAMDVTGSDTYTRLLVSAVGTDDYYSVPLPTGSTLENIVVSLSPTINGTQLRLRYALEGANGIGPYAEQSLRVIRVGNGDFQASVAWTGASDVDIHVFDPNGEHVFYAYRTATTGGTLDLDSNPQNLPGGACSIDNKNNENIVWPLNRAPAGTYRVEVHYYSDCGVSRSDWVATVLLRGQTPRIFQGSFVGPSSANPPVIIGNFIY
jgi:hypothetical protein